MIASWMLAATLLGLIAVLAATALERALRLLGRQARFAWVLALGITVGWPLLAPALIRPVESRWQVNVITASGTATSAVEVPALAPRAEEFVSAARATLAQLDGPIAILWGMATLFLLLRAGVAVRMLRRLAHHAERRIVDGQSVLVSPSVGPAAFGVLRTHIVLPNWSLDLDPAMRAMVLRHEQEHVAARDPAMLTLAWLGAALMPWNPALWTIAHRLRTATELDCDHRVLRRGTDAQRYARLLLLMVQRQTPTAFAALMAGSPTTLHQRIDAMHARVPARPRLRAALLFVLAVIASAFAASPALAGQLAAVRVKLAPLGLSTPTESGAPSATRTNTPKDVRTSVLELPLVIVSPDRSVELPVVQTPAQQPARPTVPPPMKRPQTDSAMKRPLTDSTLKPVTFAPGGSPTPRYPDILRAAGFSGDLVVQVVVDSSGLPIESTLKVVRSAHDLLAANFREVFSQIRFTPATLGDRRVRQLIQLVYRFDFEGAPPMVVPPLSPTLATFVIDVTVKQR